MHAVPASLKGKYVIRFTVTSPRTTVNDLARDWQLIRTCAMDIVPESQEQKARSKMSLKGKVEYGTMEHFDNFFGFVEIREKNSSFGTSLLLANIGPNSPMTPKIINGSYAALFENSDVITDFSKRIDDLQRDDDNPTTGDKFENVAAFEFGS